MTHFAKSLVKSSLKTFVLFWTVMFSLFSFLVVMGVLAGSSEPSDPNQLSYEYYTGEQESDRKILSIPINGVILGDEIELGEFNWLSTPGIVYGYSVKEALYQAAEEEDIKGVILEINSPGGTIYGSQAIADGIRYFRDKTKKPVIGFVSGIAASGGYWAAVTTDEIIADYGTSTGSIGVITGPFKFYDQVVSEDGGILGGGVMTEAGIETTYITAGQSKDLGNPFRKMTEAEVTSLQQMVNNEYDSFVKLVAEHRSMSQERVRNDIKALIYDPLSAQNLDLIDAIGSRETAYQTTADRAGLKADDYQVVRLTQTKNFVEEILAATKLAPTPQVQDPAWCAKLSSQILVAHNTWAEWCP